MSDALFRVEDLIGRAVHDATGRKLGHIYELVAEERDGELVVVEYLLGSSARWERIGMSARGLLGLEAKEPIRISWERMDLSDPGIPRVSS